MMELRQLSYFVAVAEELHFGRAAARVHIAQPALSTQIQALERELGVQLFVSTTRRVELTVAGETFYSRCVRILSDVALSAEATRSVAGKTARKIWIGTIYPATIGVLPAFLSKVARKYRDVQLQIKSGSTSDVIRNLESGQINLGFIRPVENIGSLRFLSMAGDEYLLAVAKDSRLTDLEEIGIEDLRDQKSMSFSRQNLSFTERYFAEIFTEANLTRNIAYNYDDTFSCAAMDQGFPQSQFRDWKGGGVDFRIGMCVAWNMEDPTAARDDIIDVARPLVRPPRPLAAVHAVRVCGPVPRRYVSFNIRASPNSNSDTRRH
jgi:DNA-binding transcriptional LysR family regulator